MACFLAVTTGARFGFNLLHHVILTVINSARAVPTRVTRAENRTQANEFKGNYLQSPMQDKDGHGVVARAIMVRGKKSRHPINAWRLVFFANE
jgi:hypothetical protein